MPKNNTWALIGAAAATVAVFVLDALLRFFASGAVWPATVEGWLQIVLPALCAGLSAVLLPHYSLSEQRTGSRVVDSAKDAPVVDTNPALATPLTTNPVTTSLPPVAPPGPPH